MATIKDIARLANVSIGTVDRVIHRRGFVAYETQKNIEQAIKELNYSPNIYARQLKLAKKYRFGVLMPELHQDGNYWQHPATGMLEAAKELEAHKIKIEFFHFDRYSENSFYDKCSQVLKEKLDGLLIAPILNNPAREILGQIPDNIPYIFFDSDLPNSKRLTFIGQDPFKSGMLAGKLMKMLIDDHGDVAIIRVLPEDYHINQRTEGFRSYFQNNGVGTRIQIYEWRESEDLGGINTLVAGIVDNPNLQGIFVTNALTYLVASYIESNQMTRKVRIIGYDLVKENAAFLENSAIDFLISQSPITQGYKGIQLLYRKLVLNQDVDNKIMMPIDVVTKENLEYCIERY